MAIGLLLLGLWLLRPRPVPAPPRRVPGPASEGLLFCAWNVENLFDDRDDPRIDDATEDWFGRDPGAFDEKVRLVAGALLAQNGGRGPDIIALVEVESRRAVERLRDAMNAGLPEAWRYEGVVHRENRTGRGNGPALLTRLAVRDDLTRTFGTRRILEVHLESRGAPLVVLAGHWTSRLRGGEAARASYADALYGRYLELARADPDVDVLIAGDFNDEPDDPSVREHLHANDDPAQVEAGERAPRLLDLTARLHARGEGTYLFRGKWLLLDHLVASPGLLDPAGWEVLPETVRIEAGPSLRIGRQGRPMRFGGPEETGPRGPSDHFAVTVRMLVRR